MVLEKLLRGAAAWVFAGWVGALKDVVPQLLAKPAGEGVRAYYLSVAKWIGLTAWLDTTCIIVCEKVGILKDVVPQLLAKLAGEGVRAYYLSVAKWIGLTAWLDTTCIIVCESRHTGGYGPTAACQTCRRRRTCV